MADPDSKSGSAIFLLPRSLSRVGRASPRASPGAIPGRGGVRTLSRLRHRICCEIAQPRSFRAACVKTDMEPKDFLYAGVIAMSAFVFFMMGLLCARKRIQGQRKLHVPFNDSGCLTELPPEEQMGL